MVRTKKRKAATQATSYDYDSDEIQVVSKAPRTSRSPLREIIPSQSQNQGQRVLDCVLIPKSPKSPSPSPEPAREQTPSTRAIHTASHASDNAETSTSDRSRPRRVSKRPSYAPDPILDGLSSEDELAIPTKTATVKRQTKKRASSVSSDYNETESSSESASEGVSEGPSESPSVSSADNFSDEDVPPPKKSKPKAAAAAVAAAKKPQTTGTKAKLSNKQSSGSKANMTNLTTSQRQLDERLPPLHRIDDMFADMTKKAIKHGLSVALQPFEGRSLRVATMCSGTESPILALQMIKDALRLQHGIELDIQHVFSAEIEPYKQAYIERNFHPPLLFKDITELIEACDDEVPIATTAYGSRARVPTDLHILIAGTSCVDYSPRNNHQKGMEDGGESGTTWAAVLAFCKSCRPPIVLLENVWGAPWDRKLKCYEDIGYETAGVLVDSKNYYLPQTRQRGYMVCFDKRPNAKAGAAAEEWKSLMSTFRRAASSPVTSFLLPNDQIVSRLTSAHLEEPKREVDWSKCEVTQREFRRKERLGNSRPVTNWQESGSMAPPEHGSAFWFHGQTERVKDTIDVCFLKSVVQKGDDARYKTRIVDLSQNPHLMGLPPPGIVGCLTPTGMNYLTDAARLLDPKESLRLQGLPLEKISLTTESDRELQNMAGNAMTSTTVGSAILSALMASPSLSETSQAPSSDNDASTDDDAKTVKTEIVAAAPVQTTAVLVEGDRHLQVDSLLSSARRAMRRCYCENTCGVSRREIRQCESCGHATCISCGGNPQHNYRGKQDLSKDRIPFQEFENELRSILPSRIKFPPLEFEKIARHAGGVHSDAVAGYLDLVKHAIDETFGLSDVRRTHCLTQTWRSETGLGRIELVLTDSHAEWRFYVEPPKHLAYNDSVRELVTQPVAKAAASNSLFESQWIWRRPVATKITASICGQGEQVPTFWSKNGLPGFQDHQQWNQLSVKIGGGKASEVERDIAGTYCLLPRCGTAFDALYKKIQTAPDESPLYLFLDPTRTRPSDKDPFVVSEVPERLEYNEVRPVVAHISPSWRPWTQSKSQSETAIMVYEWTRLTGDAFLHQVLTGLEVCTPRGVSDFRSVGCHQSAEITRSTVRDFYSPFIARRNEKVISPQDAEFASALSWTVEPALQQLSPNEWHDYGNVPAIKGCKECAPPRPGLRWKLCKGKTIEPYEDSRTAAEYEHAVKRRPPATIVEASNDSAKGLCVKLGVNFLSLAHRALSRLPASLETSATFKWMIDSSSDNAFSPPKFRLPQTKNVALCKKDLQMSIDLFPQQHLQLSWMLQQEEGSQYLLEESEEAPLPLGRRIEMRASAPVHVRSGILCDHPGFGKTVLTLALIQSESLNTKRSNLLSEMQTQQKDAAPGLLPTTATLVICPSTIMKQWIDEIQDILGYGSGVIAIKNNSDLAKRSIEEFEKAKIVVVNRSIFGSDLYSERLSNFMGVPGPATNKGRALKQWLDFATRDMGAHLSILKSSGQKELRRYIKEKYQENVASETFKGIVPSRRLRGKDYVGASDNKSARVSDKPASKSIEPAFSPLFEMFYWNRIVADEFHMYSAIETAAINSLQADKRWGLSGTPAMDDIYDISKMATFAGVPLRFHRSSRKFLKQRNIRELQREMTDFERFDDLREVSSDATYAHGHEQCQQFLDQFVRRNIIDAGIAYEDHIVPVSLDLTHYAVYTELSQHLNSLEMRIKKGSNSKSTDRDLRLHKAVESSQTAEEALCKTAAFFAQSELGAQTSDLDALVAKREQEAKQCLKEMPEAFAKAQRDEPGEFEKWKAGNTAIDVLGDAETLSSVQQICDSGAKSKTKGPSTEDESKAESGRTLTSQAHTMTRRLLVSNRSLRFVKNLKAVQDRKSGSACSRCGKTPSKKTDMAVSAYCGHVVCKPCFGAMKNNTISQCPTDGCSADMREQHLLWTNKMGQEASSPYGAKIEAAVELLHKIGRKGDQAILFVQFDNQLDEVGKALDEHGISATVINHVGMAGNQIRDFRETSKGPDRKTVIVLNASDETAAGSNLQNANHIIFLSPLLRDSQYAYGATMAQAIGRVCRPGQEKDVHVYRLVALNTIDVDILEHRERRATALAEQGAAKVILPQAARILDADEEPVSERTQLVLEDGKYSLRPQSWLVRCGAEDDGDATEKVKGKSRVAGWEDFSSLVKFSRTFTEDDD